MQSLRLRDHGASEDAPSATGGLGMCCKWLNQQPHSAHDARLLEVVQPSLCELRLDRRLWGHSSKSDGPTISNRQKIIKTSFWSGAAVTKSVPS
jgi:hypothetical protein